jgi:hypothetical protein
MEARIWERSPMDRGAIVADLVACRHDLHHLLAAATPARLRGGTAGTRWSDQKLLFHMVFGFLIARRLLPLVRLMWIRRRGVGRARLLDAGQVPFHAVNHVGSCGGALVFQRTRLAWLGDRTIDALILSLEGARDAADAGDAVPDQPGPVLRTPS